MKYFSINRKSEPVTFRQAVLSGIAADGGLYLPETFPQVKDKFFAGIEYLSFNEIAMKVLQPYTADEIEPDELKNIIERAFNFDAPLVQLSNNLYVLELFHGPTLAFKDFGARFMAQVTSYFLKDNNKQITILVATSGDTGSAVANGFYDVPGTEVILLYPSGKVSVIQEKQLTTFDKNITALEVEGNFDDCQRLVKEAFADEELKKRIHLSSANSINIARLLPQSVYYFYAYAQLSELITTRKEKKLPVVFSVPCGNLGNLTGGLMAYRMGLPVKRFIAGVNSNTVFSEYLKTGKFNPVPAIKTISNAMDVGSPSNFARIKEIFNNDYELIKKIIFSRSFTDEETLDAVKSVNKKFGYIIDPHGAVGYLALNEYLSAEKSEQCSGIVLETAHPAKFIDVIKNTVGEEIIIPERLRACLQKEKRSIKISSDFKSLKEFLINRG